uniref:R13L1/DRL21-like LRR repeat region domain-containing protein n=1 Tax=Oryza nivara TaxID=4536 RepID=A0A0E0HLY1_ORYNI
MPLAAVSFAPPHPMAPSPSPSLAPPLLPPRRQIQPPPWSRAPDADELRRKDRGEVLNSYAAWAACMHLFYGLFKTVLFHTSDFMGKLAKLKHLRYIKLGEMLEDYQVRQAKGYTDLENIENEEEAKNAKLEEKRHLDSLSLEWSEDDGTNSREDCSIILDNLEPNSILKNLKISGYVGAKIPYWIAKASVNNLISLDLGGCKNWKKLPSLAEFLLLKHLRLDNLQLPSEFLLLNQLRATAAAGSMRDGNLQNSYCSSIFARPRRQARCATASVDGGGVTTSMRRRRDGLDGRRRDNLDVTAARRPRWATAARRSRWVTAARRPRCDDGTAQTAGTDDLIQQKEERRAYFCLPDHTLLNQRLD